jgi:hypothetical protein
MVVSGIILKMFFLIPLTIIPLTAASFAGDSVHRFHPLVRLDHTFGKVPSHGGKQLGF